MTYNIISCIQLSLWRWKQRRRQKQLKSKTNILDSIQRVRTLTKGCWRHLANISIARPQRIIPGSGSWSRFLRSSSPPKKSNLSFLAPRVILLSERQKKRGEKFTSLTEAKRDKRCNGRLSRGSCAVGLLPVRALSCVVVCSMLCMEWLSYVDVCVSTKCCNLLSVFKRLTLL